jgi:4-amino-4-deoxy-L-arabinose transferase-like glycosyltransferase
MLNRGEWLTPRIFGEPQFEKPVLYYWLIIGSYKIFGINEFAARFPSALFGILGIIGIYFLGRTLFSEKTAVYSALVMATSVEYAVLARGCVTDMVLCVFILYGFLFFIKWLQKSNDGPAKGYFVMSAAALGLAVLTKGPVGLVLPAGIIFLFLAVTGRLKSILRMPFVEGVAVFFIVAAPWYYLMIKTYAGTSRDIFLVSRTLPGSCIPSIRAGHFLLLHTDTYRRIFPMEFISSMRPAVSYRTGPRQKTCSHISPYLGAGLLRVLFTVQDKTSDIYFSAFSGTGPGNRTVY